MTYYLACASYGHDRASIKRHFADTSYTLVARKAARGIYDLFTVLDHPLQPGQAAFIVRESDEVSK